MENYNHLKNLIDNMNEKQLIELNDFISGKDGTRVILNDFSGDDLIEQLRFTPVNYLQYLCMSYEERKECNDFFLDFEHDPIHFQWYQHTFEHFVEWVNTKHKND